MYFTLAPPSQPAWGSKGTDNLALGLCPLDNGDRSRSVGDRFDLEYHGLGQVIGADKDTSMPSTSRMASKLLIPSTPSRCAITVTVSLADLKYSSLAVWNTGQL